MQRRRCSGHKTSFQPFRPRSILGSNENPNGVVPLCAEPGHIHIHPRHEKSFPPTLLQAQSGAAQPQPAIVEAAAKGLENAGQVAEA